MRLPPYGKKFVPVPISGVRVVYGHDAWDVAKRYTYPIMVLPQGESPSDYKWTSDGGPALVYERGEPDEATLDELALQLLIAGASSVVALREALISSDPRVFFDREADDVAA